MTFENQEHTGHGFTLGLLVGVGIGAALGLLFAPSNGRELRHKIGDGARRLGEQSRETYQSTKQRVSEMVAGARQTAGRDTYRTPSETVTTGA
jgi:gas vesicle protein